MPGMVIGGRSLQSLKHRDWLHFLNFGMFSTFFLGVIMRSSRKVERLAVNAKVATTWVRSQHPPTEWNLRGRQMNNVHKKMNKLLLFFIWTRFLVFLSLTTSEKKSFPKVTGWESNPGQWQKVGTQHAPYLCQTRTWNKTINMVNLRNYHMKSSKAAPVSRLAAESLSRLAALTRPRPTIRSITARFRSASNSGMP